jgi:hypothetical protein
MVSDSMKEVDNPADLFKQIDASNMDEDKQTYEMMVSSNSAPAATKSGNTIPRQSTSSKTVHLSKKEEHDEFRKQHALAKLEETATVYDDRLKDHIYVGNYRYDATRYYDTGDHTFYVSDMMGYELQSQDRVGFVIINPEDVSVDRKI